MGKRDTLKVRGGFSGHPIDDTEPKKHQTNAEASPIETHVRRSQPLNSRGVCYVICHNFKVRKFVIAEKRPSVKILMCETRETFSFAKSLKDAVSQKQSTTKIHQVLFHS